MWHYKIYRMGLVCVFDLYWFSVSLGIASFPWVFSVEFKSRLFWVQVIVSVLASRTFNAWHGWTVRSKENAHNLGTLGTGKLGNWFIFILWRYTISNHNQQLTVPWFIQIPVGLSWKIGSYATMWLSSATSVLIAGRFNFS